MSILFWLLRCKVCWNLNWLSVMKVGLNSFYKGLNILEVSYFILFIKKNT